MKKEKLFTEILEWMAVLSVCAILVLRIYATFMTQPVVSYDDKHYRGIAVYLAGHMNTKEAMHDFLMPTTKRIGNRTYGYNGCLVLGLKFFNKYITEERVFQIVNLALYMLQFVFIYFLATWALREKWLLFSVLFLYLSTPIIFGISRWIMTENFVLTAFFSFPCLAIITVKNKFTKGEGTFSLIRKEMVIPVLVTYTMCLFSTLREYAVPCLIMVLGSIVVVYVINRRWVSLLSVTAVVTPFMIATKKVVGPIMMEAIAKTGIDKNYTDPHVSKYVTPFSEWIYKVVFESIGVPMLLLIIATLAGIAMFIFPLITKALRDRKFFSRSFGFIFRDHRGYRILFSGYLFLSLVYVAVIFLSRFKDQRIIIMPLITLIALLFFFLKVSGTNRFIEKFSGRIKMSFLVMMIFSWSVFYYQCFVAFGGGEDFFVSPKGPPVYNYPIHLRKLEAFGDWHVREEVI